MPQFLDRSFIRTRDFIKFTRSRPTTLQHTIMLSHSFTKLCGSLSHRRIHGVEMMWFSFIYSFSLGGGVGGCGMKPSNCGCNVFLTRKKKLYFVTKPSNHEFIVGYTYGAWLCCEIIESFHNIETSTPVVILYIDECMISTNNINIEIKETYMV